MGRGAPRGRGRVEGLLGFFFREGEFGFERDFERDDLVGADVQIEALCDMMRRSQLDTSGARAHGDSVIAPARDLPGVGPIDVDLGIVR